MLGSELISYSVLSGTYVSTGDSAMIYGNVLASTYGTTGANSIIYGNFQSGTIATAGAKAFIKGNFQAILDGTTGANSTVMGNFQTGTTGTTGAGSTIDGSFKAGGAVSFGATSHIIGAIGAATLVETATMSNAMKSSLALAKGQINTAKAELNKMGAGTLLAATMTVNTTLYAGVYSAASLSTTAGTTLYLDGQNKANQSWVFNITDILATGASTNMVLINAGVGSSVVWNTGGYASLGASSTFLGTILATDYISVGADVDFKNLANSACGGLYSATSYVSIGAGARIGSEGCIPRPTSAIVPESASYASPISA